MRLLHLWSGKCESGNRKWELESDRSEVRSGWEGETMGKLCYMQSMKRYNIDST